MSALRASVLVAVISLGPGPMVAQAPGLPTMNLGFAKGLTIGSMVGLNNSPAGDGTGVLVTATAGFRRIAFSGFVSGLTGSTLATETVVARGATMAIKLAGGPLVPVGITLLAGAGYFAPSSLTTNWRVPIGLGVSWTVPQPVVALKFWASPRLDYSRIRSPDPLADPVVGGPVPLRTTTGSDFGLSGGVNFGFLNGFGIDVAVDRTFSDGPGPKPMTLGLGASFNFR